MLMKINGLSQFWMVNAFTNERFKGNPAGVFLVEDFPEIHIMQSIATELNWSQTAFVRIAPSAITTINHSTTLQAHIRWFSPKDETPFCGHATLACSHVLFERYQHLHIINFDSLAGPLTALRTTDTHNNTLITLDFPIRQVTACPCPETLTSALRLKDGSYAHIERTYRDELIYVVVLQDPSELAQLDVDLLKISKLDARAVSVTAKGPDGFDFQSRYFAPKVGIPEDPVCGSSHARLSYLWSQLLNGKTKLKALQASARTGVLDLEIINDRLMITAKAMTVFEGKMHPNEQQGTHKSGTEITLDFHTPLAKSA